MNRLINRGIGGKSANVAIASVCFFTAISAGPIILAAPATAVDGAIGVVPLGFTPGPVAASPSNDTVAVTGSSWTTGAENDSTHLFATPEFTETAAPTFKATALAYSPDGTKLYLADDAIVHVTDPGTGAITASIDLNQDVADEYNRFGSVEGIAFDPVHDRAYILATYGLVAAGNVVVIDTATDTIVGTLPNGITRQDSFDTPRGIAVSPDGNTVYVSEWSGIDAIDTNDGTIRRITPPAQSGNSMAGELLISPSGDALYLANDVLNVLNLDTKTFQPVLDGTNPVMGNSIDISSDGNILYASSGPNVLDWNHATLSAIRTSDLSVTETREIPLDLPSATGSFYGADVAISSDDKCAYIGGGFGQELKDGPTVVEFTRNALYTVPLVNGANCGGSGSGDSGTGTATAFKQGQTLDVIFTGLAAQYTYRVRGESTPFCVDDSAIADENGEIHFSCMIPTDLDFGIHHFYAYDGATAVASIEFQVAQNGQNKDTKLTGTATDDGDQNSGGDDNQTGDNPSEGTGSLGSLVGS